VSGSDLGHLHCVHCCAGGSVTRSRGHACCRGIQADSQAGLLSSHSVPGRGEVRPGDGSASAGHRHQDGITSWRDGVPGETRTLPGIGNRSACCRGIQADSQAGLLSSHLCPSWHWEPVCLLPRDPSRLPSWAAEQPLCALHAMGKRVVGLASPLRGRGRSLVARRATILDAGSC